MVVRPIRAATRPITAKDLTEALGIARRMAHNKLNELVERGELETRKVGARGRVWWTPMLREAVDRAAPREASARREEPAEEHADRTVASDEQQRETAHTPVQDAVTVALADVEFPGSRDREACEAAVRAARAYLREHGRATMRGLVADVMPAHPVGYDVPELEPGERYRGD